MAAELAQGVREERGGKWPPSPKSFTGSLPLPLVCEALRKRQEEDYDAVACVTGMEGTGKSTFALIFAQMMDPAFDFNRIAYSNRAFRRLVETLPSRSAIVLDEAIMTSWKQEWGTREQKETFKLLTVARERGHCAIFVMPDLSELHTRIRNRRLHLHIFIPRRGLALIYGRAPLPGQKDPWHLNYWETVASKWTPTMEPGRLLAYLKNPRIGYIGFSSFPRLPPDIETAYRENKKVRLMEREEEEARGGTGGAVKWARLTTAILGAAVRNGLTLERVSQESGVPLETLRRTVELARSPLHSNGETDSSETIE